MEVRPGHVRIDAGNLGFELGKLAFDLRELAIERAQVARQARAALGRRPAFVATRAPRLWLAGAIGGAGSAGSRARGSTTLQPGGIVVEVALERVDDAIVDAQ